MIEVADRPECWDGILQELFAPGQWQRTHIEVFEGDEIESVEGRRQLHRRARDLQRRRKFAAFLQSRETRNPFIVEHNNFAIDDDFVGGQRLHRFGNLGEDARVIVAVAREQQRFATRLAGDQPITIELELEQPVVARERIILRFAVHGFDLVRIDAAAHRLFLACQEFSQLGGGAVAGFDFFGGEAGKDRFLVEDIAGRLHIRVALLDQQPVLLALFYFDERPLAVELVTLELEEELPFLESLAPILERHPFAAIPDDHSSGAVVSRWNYPLEIPVLERMVFDFHCQPLVVHVVRRTLGYRPRSQNAVHLQPQIEMEIAGSVLVHDEKISRGARDRAERLRCTIRRSLCPIGT